MKQYLATILLFLSSLAVNAADQDINKTTFVDDAPVGFVHLSQVNNESTQEELTDFYLPASIITSVSVTNLLDKESKTREIYLFLRTSEQHATNVGESPNPKCYNLDFKNVEDAVKTARRIMAIMRQAEQAGADQPATKPADKPPVKDQPSTPTPKVGPR